MKNNLKFAFLFICKYTGMFYLAKLFYKNRIRILCYHGFSLKNEEKFVPGLFIKPEIFDQRMRFLKEKNYPIITLEEAYQYAISDTIPENCVVITIDDGFYSVYDKALPILQKYEFPCTLYLTSYYFDKNCPIFMLCVDYMFWNSSIQEIDLRNLGIAEFQDKKSIAKNSNDCENIKRKIIEVGQAYTKNSDRVELLKKLGIALHQDYENINNSRILNLINQQELKECIAGGMDIQLHTHRHTFPADIKSAADEIEKNRAKINPFLSKPMEHFCYPSGEWEKEHWSILNELGIKTSTTCENGLITSKTPRHAWSRFLDSERISPIEFESEVCGFTEFSRKLRGR